MSNVMKNRWKEPTGDTQLQIWREVEKLNKGKELGSGGLGGILRENGSDQV